MAGTIRWRLLLLVCILAWGLLTAVVTSVSAQIVTQDSDSLRTGWYPNQPVLTPQTVSSESFGRVFDRHVQGQVYAQPLVANDVLLVATNSDYLYGFDAKTGTPLWERSVGPPVESSGGPAGGLCTNPSPHIGVLGTPVIDADTNTAYLVAKGYAPGNAGPRGPTRFQLHAIALDSGDERPDFPVTIAGDAQNLPDTPFDPDFHLQRPGLLLMDGAIYAGFGAICDISPYHGWVAAVSTSGHMAGLWATSPEGASIWQAGGALVSDGPGQILFTTGNSSTFDGAGAPPPGPGRQPPAGLGQAVVRVEVEAGGLMRATDFFSPWNNVVLDETDADLGSSAPMALPEQYFGTPSVPRLLLQDGKEGYLYVLDRDDLGGMGQGPDGHDKLVQRLGPYGGVWDAMASWPGDGGYVYVTSVVGVDHGPGVLNAYAYGEQGGDPHFALAGASDDRYGYGSGSPIVTSDGTSPGSAIVWGTWCPTGSCIDSELRAYAAVPSDGHLRLLWRSWIGVANKFTAPGVGDGRVYVGTRDGHIISYGAAPALAGSDMSFDPTLVGESATQQATFTAHEPMTVTDVTVDDPGFEVDLSALKLPLDLSAGSSFTLPVTFAPERSGVSDTALTIITSDGVRAFRVTGRGLRGELTPLVTRVDFEDTVVDGESVLPVALRNTGDIPLTVRVAHAPDAPFRSRLQGTTVVRPDETFAFQVTFHPLTPGTFTSEIGLESETGTVAIPLAGTALSPALSASALAFPTTPVGQTVHRTATFMATRAITVGSIDTPFAPFSVGAVEPPLPAALKAGESLSADVAFSPTVAGSVRARLRLNTSDLPVDIDLLGEGAMARFETSSPAIDFGSLAAGTSAHRVLHLAASGEMPIAIHAVRPPLPPFSVHGAPAAGTVLDPGTGLDMTIDYAPPFAGSFSGELVLETAVGPLRVGLSGSATVPLVPPVVAAPPSAQAQAVPVVSDLRIRLAHGRAQLRYRLSRAATVDVGLVRMPARRGCGTRRGACPRARRLAWRRTLRGRPGLNRAPLRLPSLAPGRYELLVQPRTEPGLTGTQRSVPFRIRRRS